MRDTSIRAIICNRGGYGAIQLLPLLDFSAMKANPKWLVGFSDITTLHSALLCSGTMSIHGPMASLIAPEKGKDRSSLLLRDLLFGRIPEYHIPSHPLNRRGGASGRLIGGNICTFSPLAGSEFDFTRTDEDYILFLEEVGEPLHNIDRLLRMLQLRGVLDRCRGVILGHFTECGETEGRPDLYGSAEELVADFLRDAGIPVCFGFPAGHDDPNFPLVIGSRVTLRVDEDRSVLSFHLPAASRLMLCYGVPAPVRR